MKQLFFLLMIVFSLKAASQVANGGFENWQNFGSYDNPSFWNSNNGASTSVFKSADSHFGSFAISIESRGPSFEGWAPGEAYTFIPTPSSSDTLFLWIKCDSLDSPAKGVVEIVAYSSGQSPQLINRLEISQGTTAYQLKGLEIPQTNADSIGIYLIAETIMGPLGYEGFVRMKADDVYLKSNISLETNEKRTVDIFPNPTTGKIRIQNALEFKPKCSLYNFTGELIKELSIENEIIDISEMKSGVYYLYLYGNKTVVRQKLVKT